MKLYVLLVLLALPLATAHHSTEPMTVDVEAADQSTGMYTFRCHPPAGVPAQYTWSVRQDDELKVETTTSSTQFTWNLSPKRYYHVGCAVEYQGKYLVYDHHIDRRVSVDPIIPRIEILSTNGQTVQARCTPYRATRYNLYWYWNHLGEPTQPITSVNNQNTITVQSPRTGLWELACGVYDLDTDEWTQTAITMDIFPWGQAYVPNNSGCIPNHTCYADAQQPVCVATTEICDGKDNDCDALVDENNVCAPPPSTGNTCYSNLKSLPATCSGGTITSDVTSGCRTVICSSGATSMKILACEKPSSTSPQYFEMYKQSGSGMKICLGTTCMQNEGYVKSSTFPMCTGTAPTCTPTTEVCDQKDNDCDGQVDEGSVCAPPPTNTCYSSVKNIPATCTGGSITTDVMGGCRTIECTNSGSSLKVLACDKTGFFELYKQGQTGTAVSKVCLLGTCISDNGYAKSSAFPVCA